LTWLVTEKERARSLDSLWRITGSYMCKTGRRNLTEAKDVSAHYHELREIHGIEAEPRTACTQRMARLMFHGGIIAKHCSKPVIKSRSRLGYGLEQAHGVRVGEAMGSGDGHGVKAAHACILRKRTTGLETVELMLEHSKTKHRRWTNSLGTTLGEAALPVSQLLRDWWRDAGMKVVSYAEGEYDVTTVDYVVVRMSMLGMSEEQLELLGKVLSASSVPEVREMAKGHMTKAASRYAAKHSMEKRYVNVFGAAHDDRRIATLMAELTNAKLSSFASIVNGPLLRATHGSLLLHMPIDPGSTYELLHKIYDEAYEMANPIGDPDPGLDLQGMDSPLWGHHSNRRMADTVARQTMAKSGATEYDIDLVFGWQERMYSQKMQLHYETRFNREQRYRVTMFL